MPSPKDIKKLLNVARGEKTAKKAATLDEIMGRLPDIDPALQARISAELDAIDQKRRDAYKVPQTSKKTGKAALAEARRILGGKEAPAVIIPSKVSNVEKAIRESKGEYGAKRVQRAADEIKNLEDQFTEGALRDAFGGDNAKALVIANPADFKYFAAEMRSPYEPALEGYLQRMAPGGSGAEDVPFLELNQNEGRLPFVSGHEGRHRNIAMEQLQYPSTLWRMLPRAALREPFPRRSQEEYLEALIQHLGTDEPLVIPEGQSWGAAMNLPKLFAEGGVAHMAKGGKLLKALRKGEQGVEAGKDLQSMVEATRPLTAAERAYLAEMAAREGEELARLRPAETAPVATKGKSKGPSPKPARAKPKTKAEISEIAERVAPQLTGEFVRAKPGQSVNVAGKSRKQWEAEQELEHDIRRSRDVPEAETIDLEPHRGSVMLSLPGDISISDYDIFSIGGEGLRMPSRQYGGPRFGLAHPEEAGWASGLEQAAGFQRRATAASQQYGDVPVLANFMAMGPEGLNYAQHYADALLKLSKPERMTAGGIDDFNRVMRSGTAKHDFSDFPGIEHPEAAYLYMAANPAARKHYNSIMQLGTLTEPLNLPSGLNVRHAVSEPELRDLERGMTGFSLMEMQPGVERLKPSAHPTYSHDIPGKFIGRTDILYPYEITFPDTVAAIRANPKQAKSEFGTMQMLGGKQIIDNQLLDEMMRYRERIKELTGKAEGGVVHMQGGGNPGEVSGDMFKPKPLEMPSIFADAAAKLKAQFEKERRSMRKPGAVQDVLMRGPVAFSMGAPMDIIGMGGEALDYLQTKIPGLRERASVMDTGPERVPTMGYAPKVSLAPEGRYGTEAAQDLLKQAGLTTDEERPLFELGAGITAPIAGAAALKTGKALAPTARDVLEMQLERSMKPYQMAIAPEGKAGKVKAPANKVGFYNPAEKAALNLQRKKGPGSAFVSDMQKTPGVNQERLNDLGLGDLASRPDVTRDEILQAAEQNRIPLRETVRRPYEESSEYSETIDGLKSSNRYYEGGIQQMRDEIARVSAMAPDSPLIAQFERKIEAMREKIAQNNERIASRQPSLYGPDSHPDYNMPGGENYREIRVGLPSNKRQMSYEDWRKSGSSEEWSSKGTVGEDFMHQTHHGDEPNVLFHLRVADHTDVEGKRGLLIDELQSDWHQQGREKGYNVKKEIVGFKFDEAKNDWVKTSDEEATHFGDATGANDILYGSRMEAERRFGRGVPDAPFKDNWYQLGLKRAIKEAADTGMDRVYLTTGARQADRYDLSKHIDRIELFPNEFPNKAERPYYFVAYDKTGRRVMDDTVTPEKLGEYIGKDASKKLLSIEPNKQGERYLEGADLQVGGEGMKQYYDKTYKNFLDKYAKQFGGRVGETKIAGGETVYYIDITPKMRESAKIGQSYKDGGSVSQDGAAPQDLTAHLNNLLRQHHGMAEGGAVNLEEKLNNLLRQHHGMAEGGQVDSPYNTDPDMSDQGMFVQAPAFAEGGAVKSIRTVN